MKFMRNEKINDCVTERGRDVGQIDVSAITVLGPEWR
jgi:hypothetical protein